MGREWSEIADLLRTAPNSLSDPLWSSALTAVADLADHLAQGPLAQALFGWTSMHDLCIQQTDATPYSGPYLRVSPLATGMVEFCYEDSHIPARRWTREVPPRGVIGRFDSFLDQLRWVGRMSA